MFSTVPRSTAKVVEYSATSSHYPLIVFTELSFLCSPYIVLGCYSLVLKDNVGPPAWEACYKRRPVLIVRERESAR